MLHTIPDIEYAAYHTNILSMSHTSIFISATLIKIFTLILAQHYEHTSILNLIYQITLVLVQHYVHTEHFFLQLWYQISLVWHSSICLHAYNTSFCILQKRNYFPFLLHMSLHFHTFILKILKSLINSNKDKVQECIGVQLHQC